MIKQWLKAAVAPALLSLSACASGPNSEAEIEYWKNYEIAARNAGLMRTERNPPGITVSNAQLIRNFKEVMFYDEYACDGDNCVEKRVPKRLDKLVGDIGYQVIGNSVTPRDLRQVADAADRLSRASGLTISRDKSDPTVRIFILSRAERLDLAKRWKGSEDWGPVAQDLSKEENDPVCVAYAQYTFGPSEDRSEHVIIIPNEVSNLLRQSCIEEEFGQVMGPAADFSGARPSVFNDDEEFALLTTHDELLIRILYDPRLRHGMTERESMPIVRRIVAEMRPHEIAKEIQAEMQKARRAI